jgi:hypothetical protein
LPRIVETFGSELVNVHASTAPETKSALAWNWPDFDVSALPGGRDLHGFSDVGDRECDRSDRDEAQQIELDEPQTPGLSALIGQPARRYS